MTTLILIVVNILVLIILALIFNYRLERIVRRQSFLKRIRSEIEAILVECNQTTDRNLALLEGRIKGLKALIEQADRRIMLLRRTSAAPTASPTTASAYSEHGHRRPHHIESPRQPQPPPRQPDPTPPPAQPLPPAQPTDRRAQIVAMSRAGLLPQTIATRLGVPIGEVELVQSLENSAEKPT